MATKKNPTRQGRVENPVAAQARAERAFGGSWGTHDVRPNRERTRRTAQDAAIRSFDER